jgi:hypothetical protein
LTNLSTDLNDACHFSWFHPCGNLLGNGGNTPAKLNNLCTAGVAIAPLDNQYLQRSASINNSLNGAMSSSTSFGS